MGVPNGWSPCEATGPVIAGTGTTTGSPGAVSIATMATPPTNDAVDVSLTRPQIPWAPSEQSLPCGTVSLVHSRIGDPMKRLRSLGAICVLAAMTACTTGGASPAPTLTTNTPILPAAPSSPSPSSNPSQDALIEEAIAVYKRAAEARWQQYKTGGLAPEAPTPESFTATMAGNELDESLAVQYNGFVEGVQVLSGELTIRNVRLDSEILATSGEVTLVSCEDGREIEIVRASGKKSSGQLMRASVRLAPSKGTLKIFASENTKVETCSSG